MISAFMFVTIAFVVTIANRLYAKKILNDLDSFALAILTNALGAILVLPFIIGSLDYYRTLPSAPLALILLTGILWTYVAWAGNLSIAQNNFSFKEVIRQTRSIWVVLAGIFLLDETLSPYDILGVALVISSVFIISFKEFTFKDHYSSKPILLAWSVALVAGCLAILEKIILTDYGVSVLHYGFLAYLFPAVFLAFFLTKERFATCTAMATTHYLKVAISSTLMVVSYLASLKSYALLPIAIAYPLIQSSTVVGVLIGTILFENGEGWRKKVLASCVAICGIILVRFY